MIKREWDEIDEQMAREGQARIKSMRSVGQPRRAHKDRDTIKPGTAHVPMKGTGGGEKPQSLGQTLWATNYSS